MKVNFSFMFVLYYFNSVFVFGSIEPKNESYEVTKSKIVILSDKWFQQKFENYRAKQIGSGYVTAKGIESDKTIDIGATELPVTHNIFPFRAKRCDESAAVVTEKPIQGSQDCCCNYGRYNRCPQTEGEKLASKIMFGIFSIITFFVILTIFCALSKAEKEAQRLKDIADGIEPKHKTTFAEFSKMMVL